VGRACGISGSVLHEDSIYQPAAGVPPPVCRTRTYYDFETKTAAFDGVVRIFEEHLKSQNPRAANITYDVQDLFTFLDGLADISCLVLDPQSMRYDPYPRDYIKQQVRAPMQSAGDGNLQARHWCKFADSAIDATTQHAPRRPSRPASLQVYLYLKNLSQGRGGGGGGGEEGQQRGGRRR
jgi:hypothetical protein